MPGAELKRNIVKLATVVIPLLLIIVFIVVRLVFPDWEFLELLKICLVDLSIGVIAGYLGGYIFLLWMSRPPKVCLGDIYEEDKHFKFKLKNNRKKAWFPHDAAATIVDISAMVHIVSSITDEDPEHSFSLTVVGAKVILMEPGKERTFKTHDNIDKIRAQMIKEQTSWGEHKDIGLRYSVVCRDGLSNVPFYRHKMMKVNLTP